MAQIVGKLPEFTEDTPPVESVQEEVKEAPAEEVVVEEKETPAPPAEKPVEQPLGEDTKEPLQPAQDSEKVISSLQEERVKLLREISELRGQRRELKQEELRKVDEHLDELKDLHPDDITVIDRVLRSKGYINKEQADRMFYDAVKQEEEAKFFDKYPEYKVENDPNGTNWASFEREVARLKELGWNIPQNPRKIFDTMEMIHKNVVKVPSERSLPVKQHQVKTASVGSGGTQRSSPVSQKLDPDKRAILERGGWSEEEIAKIEAKLS